MYRHVTYYVIEGWSPVENRWKPLFAPYHTKQNAESMLLSLRERNPQIDYRVECRKED